MSTFILQLHLLKGGYLYPPITRELTKDDKLSIMYPAFMRIKMMKEFVMNSLILADEVASFNKHYASMTKNYMHPPKLMGIKKRGRFLYDHVYVVTDGNPMGKYMAACMDTLLTKGGIRSLTCLSVGDGDNLYPEHEYTTAFETVDVLTSKVPNENCAYLFFVDCRDGANADAWADALSKVTAHAAQSQKTRCVVCAMLAEYPAIPQGIESLAEREFSYFMECTLENPTPGQQFYVALEKQCRAIVGGGYSPLNLVRVDNLFGPDANCITTFDLDSFVAQAFEAGTVKVEPADYRQTVSISYIQPALRFASWMMYYGRDGQIYNFCSHTVTLANIKLTLQEAFRHKLGLETKVAADDTMEYRCLNTLKFFQAGWTGTRAASLNSCLYQTVCNITGERHNNSRNIAIYAGKLPRIKELEMMMLKDIDDICRKHNIQYFLCGGTMLGAIRYGHSIPWDDDLDIGMLRPDFDKFRKVIEQENKDIYGFSSNYNKKSGSHYIVDKVRLNGTYFSTKYSSIHEYPDGLFIDVLVYDRTTNNKLLGMIQCKLLYALSKAVELRWYNKPRKNFHYKKTLLIIPLLRIFPIGFYHKTMEWVMQWFKHTKTGRMVVDSTGKLQKKGPFSIDGLEEVQYVDYDGDFQVPIPADPTSYLTFDYGPNYLPEPPLSQRKAPHNFARIDLGEYIFDTHETPVYRDVNVHGELFETEIE